jgi:hypothetical protein
MTEPKETISIRLDVETTAVMEIQIRTEPSIPAAMESDRLSVPTARQLRQIGEQIASGRISFL